MVGSCSPNASIPPLKRGTSVQCSAANFSAPASPWPAQPPSRPARGAAPAARVRPGAPGWPADADWARSNARWAAGWRRVPQPDLTGPEAAKLLANPFYIADQPGLTESSGWLDAWRSSPSA